MKHMGHKQAKNISKTLDKISAKTITKKPQQLEMLKKQPLAYGGELLKTREGRSTGRTIVTKDTMHLVLRSSLAHGEWSFSRPDNKTKLKTLISKFSSKYFVKVISVAFVGNHLHFHVQFLKQRLYAPFIRALTAAIAMAVSGASRWKKNVLKDRRFWDYRPYTRVVKSYKAFLNLKDYININKYEGVGYTRKQARYLVMQDEIIKCLSRGTS